MKLTSLPASVFLLDEVLLSHPSPVRVISVCFSRSFSGLFACFQLVAHPVGVIAHLCIDSRNTPQAA